jgi:saccharopine dehydrogenase-like NADP-dependent oxidoreductase
VPAVAAAILIARGDWGATTKTMVNVEELNPDPFIDLLKDIGLPTETIKVSYSKKSSKTSK